MSRFVTVLFVGIAGLAAADARATGACVGATGGVVVPDGRVPAPRNATPFVDADVASRLLRDDGVEIDVDVDVITVVGGTFGDGQVFRLRPRELLEPGRSYDLVEGIDRAFVQSTFTVADIVDDEAPLQLRAEFNPGPLDSCGATSINLKVSDGSVAEEEARVGAALFAAASAAPTLDDGTTWNGAGGSMHNALALHGVNDGDTMHVVGIDLAGNIGPSIALTLEAAQPVAGTSCSASGLAPLVGALAALFALRPRTAAR